MQCKTEYLSTLGFSQVTNGNQHCCIFKFLGSDLWLRTPACSASNTISCLVTSESHATVRYARPTLCNAKHLHIRFTRPLMYQPPTSTAITNPTTVPTSEASIHPFFLLPLLAALPILILCYYLVQYYSRYHLYPVEHPRTWRVYMASVITILSNDAMTIYLHTPPCYDLHLSDLRFCALPLPFFTLPTATDPLHFWTTTLLIDQPLLIRGTQILVLVAEPATPVIHVTDEQHTLYPTLLTPLVESDEC